MEVQVIMDAGAKKVVNSLYQQGRVCSVCGIFIPDNWKGDICEKCPQDGIKKNKESTEHKKLKEIGRAWLLSQGCIKIREEYHVSRKAIGQVIFDLAAELNGEGIAVECGGNQKRKLDKAARITPNLYLLPYGAQIPVRYHPTMRICQNCGHIY